MFSNHGFYLAWGNSMAAEKMSEMKWTTFATRTSLTQFSSPVLCPELQNEKYLMNLVEEMCPSFRIFLEAKSHRSTRIEKRERERENET